jgi:hypothetical protein
METPAKSPKTAITTNISTKVKAFLPRAEEI